MIELAEDGFIGDEAGNDAALRITAPAMKGIRIEGTTIVAASLFADQGPNLPSKPVRKPLVFR
jgi:hypothetical protein